MLKVIFYHLLLDGSYVLIYLLISHHLLFDGHSRIVLFIYLGFYVAFNIVQVIS